MLNAVGQPDTVLLLGGSSAIAVATALEWARERPVRVLVAARPGGHRDAAAARLAQGGARVEIIDFDARPSESGARDVDAVFDRWEVDVALVAHGVLPDQRALELDPAGAAAVCEVNFASAVVVGLALAARMRAQGHGVIVAMSSGGRGTTPPRQLRLRVDQGRAGRVLPRPAGPPARNRRAGRRRASRLGPYPDDRGPPPRTVQRGADQVARAIVDAAASTEGPVWVPRVMAAVALGLRIAPRRLLRRA